MKSVGCRAVGWTAVAAMILLPSLACARRVEIIDQKLANVHVFDAKIDAEGNIVGGTAKKAYLKTLVTQLRFEKYDGEMSEVITREASVHGKAVAAVIYNPAQKKLLFVQQFRYPVFVRDPKKAWFTEVLAGMQADKHEESAADAMRREMEEEAKIRVQKLEQIATFFVAPGSSSETITLFYAETDNDLTSGRVDGLKEEAENIKSLGLTIEEAWSLVEQGEIVDAKSIIGLQWFKMNKQGK